MCVKGVAGLLCQADLYAVADKYNIAPLGKVAKRRFKGAASEKNLDDDQYLEIIKHAYDTTPESNRGLCDVIVSEIQTGGIMIRTNTIPNFRQEEIVSTTPQFAWDLIQTSLLNTALNQSSDDKKEAIKNDIKNNRQSDWWGV